MTADKNIFVVESIVNPLPLKVILGREFQKSLGPYGNAVSDSAYRTLAVPVSVIVLGKRPGRTDVIVLKELVIPVLGMNNKSVRMNKQHKISIYVVFKFIDHFVIKFINAVEF